MGSSRAMAQKKKVVPIDDHTVGWKNIAARMKRELIGQDEVINELCPYLTIHKTGLSPEGRPVGNFLLLGPTGTGKTRMGEVLAKCIHGHERMLIRIDCGEYQMEHEIAKLVGAPPGYLGHRETQPILTQQKLNAVCSESSNLSIVVFDEIEKAASSMIKILLGVLDKAVLKLGDNTSVNFERSIILMTSNMGAKELKSAMAPDFGYSTFAPVPATSVSKMNNIGNSAAKRRLPPEFMNRIDQIFTFKTLSRENIEQILAIELGKIESHVRERLELPGFELILHEDAIDWIVDNGFSQEYGGRNLKRLLHKRVLYPIAQSVEAEEIEDGDVASFTVSDGDLQYQVL